MDTEFSDIQDGHPGNIKTMDNNLDCAKTLRNAVRTLRIKKSNSLPLDILDGHFKVCLARNLIGDIKVTCRFRTANGNLILIAKMVTIAECYIS